MIRDNFSKHLIYIFIFLRFASLNGANYGQWGFVNQYTEALVIVGPTNTIRRLALFDGLTFQDSTAAAVYTALLPISGNVNLNGGILYLDRELRFGDLVNFVGPGKILGNGEVHDVTFPGTFGTLSYSYTYSDAALMFNNDVELNSALTFQSTCTINGDGNQIDLRGGGVIYIDESANVTFQNISILGLNDHNVRCIADDSFLFLDNSSLILSGTYTFTKGNIDVTQESAITGTGLFAYQSTQEFTIHSQSKLLIDYDTTFSYDSLAASKDKLVMKDATATLHLRGCTLYSTHTGLELTTGKVLVEDHVICQNEASNIAEAMVFKEPLEVHTLSGGILDLSSGLFEEQ
jgi:hypothetical protein